MCGKSPREEVSYISKEDVKDTYGAVQGCRGCQAALRGEEPRPHNARCRVLKEQQILEKDPDRYYAALERKVKEVEKKKRKVEEEEHQLDTGASSSQAHQGVKSSGRSDRRGKEEEGAR